MNKFKKGGKKMESFVKALFVITIISVILQFKRKEASQKE
jgi:hypothetical protein